MFFTVEGIVTEITPFALDNAFAGIVVIPSANITDRFSQPSKAFFPIVLMVDGSVIEITPTAPFKASSGIVVIPSESLIDRFLQPLNALLLMAVMVDGRER